MAETSVSSGRLTTFESPAVLAEEVAGWIMRHALDTDGTFSICLSGGSTPKALYEQLAKPPFADEFPWDRTHWFFGDERFVPDGDPDNNYTMAKKALLSQVPVPEANIHRIVTEVAAAQQAAADYERVLKQFYGADRLDPHRPLFDINLLGLGPDGHTASLIPGQSVLNETDKWVAEVSEGRPEIRITLTYPVLASSRHIAFLVTGAGKKDMLAHVRSGATDVPAGRLKTGGDVHWFVDRAAVGA